MQDLAKVHGLGLVDELFTQQWTVDRGLVWSKDHHLL